MLKKLFFIFGALIIAAVGFGGLFLKIYFKNIALDSFSLHKNRLVLKRLAVENRNFAFSAEKIKIAFFSKQPNRLVKPHLRIKKRQAFSRQGRRFSWKKWQMEKGEIKLELEKEKPAELFFSISPEKSIFSFDSSNPCQIEYLAHDQSLAVKQVDLKKAFAFLKLWLNKNKNFPADNVRGRLSAKGFFSADKNIFLDLHFSKLAFLEKKSLLNTSFEQLDLSFKHRLKEPLAHAEITGSFQQAKILEKKSAVAAGFFACNKGELTVSLQDKKEDWFLEGFFPLEEKSFHVRVKKDLAELVFQKRSSGECALSGQKINPQITQLVQTFLQKCCPGCLAAEMKAGEASFYAEWDGGCQKPRNIKIAELNGRKIKLAAFDSIWTVDDLSAKAQVDLLKSHFVQNAKLQMNLGCEAFFQGKKLLLQEGSAVFSVKKGQLGPSFFTFNLNGLKGQFKCFGEGRHIKAVFSGKGPVQDFLDPKDELICSLSLQKEKEYLLSGLLQLKENKTAAQTFSFGLKTKNPFRGRFLDKWQEKLSNFWIKAEKLNLAKLSRFFNLPKSVLQGKANLSCFYQNEEFNLDFQGEELYFKNSALEIYLPQIGSVEDFFLEDYLSLSCNLKTRDIQVKTPVLKGDFAWFKHGLNCHFEKALLKAQAAALLLEVEKGKLNGIDLSGRLQFDFLQKKKWSLEAVKAAGSIQNLCGLLDNFGLVKHPGFACLQGSFKSGKGFFLEQFWEEQKTLFRLDLDVVDLSFKKGFKNFRAENFQGKVVWDSCQEKLILSQVRGDLDFLGHRFQIRAPWIKKEGQKAVFDAEARVGELELARLSGSGILTDKTEIFLDKKKSHLLSEELLLKHCRFSDGKLELLDISFSLPLKEAALYAAFLRGGSFRERPFSGTVQSRIFFDKNQGLSALLEGKKLKIYNRLFNRFALQAEQDKTGLKINRCFLDKWELGGTLTKSLTLENSSLKGPGCLLKGRLAWRPNRKIIDGYIDKLQILKESSSIFFASFFKNFSGLQADLQGKGLVSLNFQNQPAWECDLDLDTLKAEFAGYAFENKTSLNVHFDFQKGLQAKGMDLLIATPYKVAEVILKADFVNLDIREKKWQMHRARAALPFSLLQKLDDKAFRQFWDRCGSWLEIEKQIDLTADLQGTLDLEQISGKTEKIDLIIDGQKQYFKNVSFQKNKSCFAFQSQLRIGSSYHPLKGALEFRDSLAGSLSLGMEKLPLTAFFTITQDTFKIQKIKGSYCGLTADFTAYKQPEEEKNYFLLGSLLLDFSQIIPHFWGKDKKLEMLQAGSGFRLQGKLGFLHKEPRFSCFQGKLLGKDLQIGGCRLKSLSSDLQMQSSRISLQNFTLSDMAGRLKLDKLFLQKKDGAWHFSLPYIGLLDFRPSLLSKIQGKQPKQTPLLIRRAEFFSLQGRLDDLKTISGTGSLLFINSFKRGYNILEIPADFLGRIVGLDTELLIPVCGHLELEFKEGRLHLRQLKDAYSENRRSKFFLIHPSYVDLHGGLNLNFRMKQDVLFKLTENFILSFKGTVFQPRVKMVKKRK